MSEMRRFLQDPSCILAESFGNLQYLRDRWDVNGNPTIVEGPHGKSIHLDADGDFIGFKDDARFDFDGLQDFSVVSCIKQDVAGQNAIISKYDYGTDKGWLFSISSGDALTLALGTNTARAVDSSGVIGTGWIIIGGVVDTAGTIDLYKHGLEVSSYNIHDAPVAVNSPTGIDLTAGRRADTVTWDMDGKIAWNLVFNRVLSAKEMLNLAKGRSF